MISASGIHFIVLRISLQTNALIISQKSMKKKLFMDAKISRQRRRVTMQDLVLIQMIHVHGSVKTGNYSIVEECLSLMLNLFPVVMRQCLELALTIEVARHIQNQERDARNGMFRVLILTQLIC